ncbi:uncharacterized protein EI90DRAFT_2912163, partial [Cantharellus anzutake]|uniref:uncharacterized protein n=1 Tax=Cantharellus anzutake TaxID=1750568 RepID=UPI001908C8D5
LPLLPQMPVLVCENFDVSGGIVNGSEGIVQSVRYTVDEDGVRTATSCIVNIENSCPEPFTDLTPHQCVILPKSINIKVTHPFSGETVRVKRSCQKPVGYGRGG